MIRRIALAIVGLLFCAVGAQAQSGLVPNGLDTYSCHQAVIYDASTSGATQLVAAGGPLVICGYKIWVAGAVNVDLIFGTGTNCATTPTKITPAFQMTTSTQAGDDSVFFRGLYVPPNQALCINTSAGVAVQAIVYYRQ